MWVQGGGIIDSSILDFSLESAAGEALPSVSLVSDASQKWYILNIQGNATYTSSENIIAWWLFDETTGTSAADATGNGNTGTLVDLSFDANSVQGKIGNALDFTGSDDVVNIPITTTFGQGAKALTLCAWVYLDESSAAWDHDQIFAFNENASDFIYLDLDGAATGIIEFTAVQQTPYDGAVCTADAGFTGQQWVHVAGTMDSGGFMQLYINGVVQADTDTFDRTVAPTSASIGNATTPGSVRLWNGFIDDARIYDRALSAAEILHIYQLGSP